MSNGLVTKSYAPARIAAIAVSSEPNAVMTMTGTSGRFSFKRAQRSRPFIPRIFTSVTTTSKSSRRARSKASSARRSRHHLEPAPAEAGGEELAHLDLVVDDEDAKRARGARHAGHEGSAGARGSFTANALPTVGSLWTEIQPP